jgi:hypothetical protein
MSRRTSIAIALTALVAAAGGTALAAGDASTTLHMRVTEDGKLIGNGNDGTVRRPASASTTSRSTRGRWARRSR